MKVYGFVLSDRVSTLNCGVAMVVAKDGEKALDLLAQYIVTKYPPEETVRLDTSEGGEFTTITSVEEKEGMVAVFYSLPPYNDALKLAKGAKPSKGKQHKDGTFTHDQTSSPHAIHN